MEQSNLSLRIQEINPTGLPTEPHVLAQASSTEVSRVAQQAMNRAAGSSPHNEDPLTLHAERLPDTEVHVQRVSARVTSAVKVGSLLVAYEVKNKDDREKQARLQEEMLNILIDRVIPTVVDIRKAEMRIVVDLPPPELGKNFGVEFNHARKSLTVYFYEDLRMLGTVTKDITSFPDENVKKELVAKSDEVLSVSGTNVSRSYQYCSDLLWPINQCEKTVFEACLPETTREMMKGKLEAGIPGKVWDTCKGNPGELRRKSILQFLKRPNSRVPRKNYLLVKQHFAIKTGIQNAILGKLNALRDELATKQPQANSNLEALEQEKDTLSKQIAFLEKRLQMLDTEDDLTTALYFAHFSINYYKTGSQLPQRPTYGMSAALCDTLGAFFLPAQLVPTKGAMMNFATFHMTHFLSGWDATQSDIRVHGPEIRRYADAIAALHPCERLEMESALSKMNIDTQGVSMGFLGNVMKNIANGLMDEKDPPPLQMIVGSIEQKMRRYMGMFLSVDDSLPPAMKEEILDEIQSQVKKSAIRFGMGMRGLHESKQKHVRKNPAPSTPSVQQPQGAPQPVAATPV